MRILFLTQFFQPEATFKGLAFAKALQAPNLHKHYEVFNHSQTVTRIRGLIVGLFTEMDFTARPYALRFGFLCMVFGSTGS